MGEDRAIKTTAVMSTLTASILAADVLLRNKSSQATTGFPPEALQLLQGIAAGMQSTLGQLNEIIAGINGLSFEGAQGYPPNADYVTSVVVQCQAINQAYDVPSMTVPDNFSAVIKAHPTNAVGSLIYVVTSPAPNVNSAYPLVPNEAYAIKIKDTGKIRLFTNLAGSQAVVSVEQRSG